MTVSAEEIDTAQPTVEKQVDPQTGAVNLNFGFAKNQATTATTVGPAPIATFDASAADMPLKGMTVNIEPVQAGSGDPSPDNVRPISGWTGCKLHRTGVSLIGGDAFIGNTFAKNGEKYELSYNGSGVANRASGYADISGIPEGRYVLQFLNCSYPDGIDVTFRQRTNGTLTTVGTIIGSSTSGVRAFNIPANTTELQFYIVPNSTVTIGDKVTMDDAILYRYGETAEPYKGNTYPVTFPTEAGTVYGGTLMINADGSGELTVDKAIKTIDDQTSFSFSSATTIGWFAYLPTHDMEKLSDYSATVVSDSMMTIVSEKDMRNHLNDCIVTGYDDSANTYPGQNWIYWKVPGIESKNDMIAWLGLHSFTVVYPLASPIAYGFSDIHEITTLLGTNNIWADCGDVTVTYGAYLETVKAHAERLGDSILSAIAPLEASYTASRTYAVGSYLFVGTKFYKVTQAIAEGGTITPGTNAVQTTVAEQLMALAAG